MLAEALPDQIEAAILLGRSDAGDHSPVAQIARVRIHIEMRAKTPVSLRAFIMRWEKRCCQ